MTISADGFVAAPASAQPGVRRRARLHDWFVGTGSTGPSVTDSGVADEMLTETGRIHVSRRTFDVGLYTWGERGTRGVPCFVVTETRGCGNFTPFSDRAA